MLDHRRLIHASAAALLAAVLCGCSGSAGSDDRPDTAPVTGTVTHNGSPVADADVSFKPAVAMVPGSPIKAHAAFGRTNTEGKYTLKTGADLQGAVPGDYVVTVIKYDRPPVTQVPDVDDPAYDPDAEANTPPPKNLLPAKYETERTSDLKVTVKDGDNDIPLTLKDE